MNAPVDYEQMGGRQVRRFFIVMLAVELVAGVRAVQYYRRNPLG